MKITYENIETGMEEQVYAHQSVFRKSFMDFDGANASPEYPMLLGGGNNLPKATHYDFPFPAELKVPNCYWKGMSIICAYQTIKVPSKNGLEISIVYADNNKSGKLRKPFIITDGFDPGDNRDFFENKLVNPDKLLDKEKDDRGLYELLEGVASPWNKNQPTAGLATALRKEGYDLIFVNYKEGAGEIVTNARLLRKFLNEEINGRLRDEYTEESVLVGPSMGGIITRIALREMEINGEEHLVRSWISFDSPHKGASIPIALQHSVALGGYFFTGGKSNPMDGSRIKLHSEAARQLLISHYTRTNTIENSDYMHVDLQEYLNGLGMPRLCKTYSITNGGLYKLHHKTSQKIIDFKLDNLSFFEGYINDSGEGIKKVFEGNAKFSDHQYTYLVHGLGVENSVGGWIAALYSLNYSKPNDNKVPDTGEFIHRQKSTFIPTVSAFGLNITAESVYRPWTAYTNYNDEISGKIKTPFDEIYGMPGINEEHVAITPGTKEYINEKWIQKDIIKNTKPFVRLEQTNHQYVSKPALYSFRDTISFAEGNNLFTVNTDAIVNVEAGKSIRFLPGFKVKSGAKLHAKISSSSVARKNEEKDVFSLPVKEFKEDNFVYSKHSYADLLLQEAFKSELSFNNVVGKKHKDGVQVYPNPFSTQMEIDLSNIQSNSSCLVELRDVNGALLKEVQFNAGAVYQLETSFLSSGTYFLKISSLNQIFQTKIIKL